MPNRYFSPVQQYPNAPGGSLYFFVSNTSTPQDTFNDINLAQRNPNPIILDASGYATSIFLVPGLTYKVVLTAAGATTDSPIFTADPVLG